MDTCFHILELRPSARRPAKQPLKETMHNSKQLNTCFVCGHRLHASERFAFENPGALRHRNCSIQRHLSDLRERAESLGLSSLDLLTRRLAQLQDQIVQALGEVSFEQFQTAESVGYLHLFLSSDLKVRVAFSRHVQSEAIYHETLIAPDELQQQKTRLLLRVSEQTRARPELMHTEPPERFLADCLIVADWLKQAEEHWSGRTKEEIAFEVIATDRVQLKILKSSGMDFELALRPFVPNSSKFEPIAQQILSAEDSEVGGPATITQDDLVEAL